MKLPAGPIGWVFVVVGFMVWVWGLRTKTIVDVYESEPVYNLGMLAEQSQIVTAGLALIIVGAIMIAAGSIINHITDQTDNEPSNPRINNDPSDEYLG